MEALLRLTGASLVALAALFLISTGISRGYITPPLQLLGAAIIGGLSMGAGLRLQDREPWGSTLAIVGSAVVTASAAAGHGWLELYGPVTGLILTSAATVITAALAVRLANQWVATTASLTLLLIPTWAGIIEAAPVGVIGTWLGLFTLAAAALGLWQRWGWYRLISGWSVAPWLVTLLVVFEPEGANRIVAGGLIGLVSAVLWLGPLLSDWRGDEADRSDSVRGWERASVAIVPLWTWIAVLTVTTSPGNVDGIAWQARYAVLVAVAFLAVALVAQLAIGSRNRNLFAMQLLGAITLGALGTLVWFDGTPQPVVFLGLSVATYLAARSIDDDRSLRWVAAVLAALGSLGLLVELVELVEASNLRTGLDHVVTAAIGLLLGAVGVWCLWRWEPESVGRLAVAWLAAGVSGLAAALTSHAPDRYLVESFLVLTTALTAALWAVTEKFSRPTGVVALVTGAAAMLLTTILLFRSLDDVEVGLSVRAATLYAIIALGLATWRLWSDQAWRGPALVATWIFGHLWVLAAFLPFADGQVGVSILWAAAAVGAIWFGVRRADSFVRTLGLISLTVVIMKLLSVDLAEVDTLWRVLLFLVVGLGLLRLAYVLPGLEQRADEPQP
jgi:hypothetical protein